MRVALSILWAALACGCAAAPQASEAAAPSPEEDQETAQIDETAETEPPLGLTSADAQPGRGRVDATHAWLSGSISGAANWLDGFLGNERHEAEENQTEIRLRFESKLAEYEDPEFKSKVRARFSFPGTEDRLRLVFAGNPEDELDPAEELLLDDAVQFNDENESSAAVGAQYFLLDSLRRNLRLDANVRVRDEELVYRLGARYREQWEFTHWLTRLTERLRWDSEDGYDSLTTLDFDRLLNERFFFRATTDLSIYEDDDSVYYGQSFALSQRLAKTKLLSYIWANRFRSEPHNVLEVTRLRLRYRQPVYRDWTFFEITPEVRFREQEDYDPTLALTFRLDLYIGAGLL